MAVSKSIKEEPIKITGLSIRNFKGIAKCDIEDISQVNLLLGKNDSGKSSVMEALFFLLKEYSENALSNIMSRRTDVFTGGREIWYGYETDNPINICVNLKGGSDLGLTLRYEKNQISTQYHGSYGMSSKKPQRWKMAGSTYMGKDFTFSIGQTEKIMRLPIANVNKNHLGILTGKTSFIDCKSKSMVSQLERELAEIKLKGKSNKFGAILKKCYGKGDRWEFLPHADMPSEVRLTLKEGGKTIFVSDLGDGFRLGLSLLSRVFEKTNTCIFVEEIENHQHPGSLKQLLASLIQVARQNNLQLFITTHSSDTWNSLARGVYLEDPEKEKSEFRCFLLDRNQKNGLLSVRRTEDVSEIDKALERP